jgi:hypothetical protein
MTEVEFELVEAWTATHRKYKGGTIMEHHVLIFPSGHEPKPGINCMLFPDREDYDQIDDEPSNTFPTGKTEER